MLTNLLKIPFDKILIELQHIIIYQPRFQSFELII